MNDLGTGEVFAGYTIENRLGAGGWGIVYLAADPRLPRPVALKLLDPTMADDEARHRFALEADLTARLDHPNIVTIYDRGVEGEIPWIAMQYVPGGDAAALLGVEPERALRIGAQIADALDHAHRAGVLHRDVKPSNFLITPAEPGQPERVLLTDFGIARLRDATSRLTRTGSVTGTAAYISPEQVSGEEVDHRADQYSLACSLFVLLTGQPPYPVSEPIALAHAHVYSPPMLPGHLVPRLQVLDRVFAKALAKQPDDRYATCAEFIADAHRALALPVPPESAATPRMPTPANTTAVSAPTPPTTSSPASPTTSSPTRAAASSLTPPARAPEDQTSSPAPTDTTAVSPATPPEAAGPRSRRTSPLVVAAAAVAAVIIAAAGFLIAGTDTFGDDAGGAAPVSGEAAAPGGASTPGWDDRHRAAATAFPDLVGDKNANTGWQGATCTENDPGSAERRAYRDFARISCYLPMDENGTDTLSFDILDRAGTAQAGRRLDQLITTMSEGCQPRDQNMDHPRTGKTLRVVTCAGVDYRRDTHTSTYVWTYFPGPAYTRFVVVARWPGHTVDALLNQWWKRAPLGN
ncbi:protein kinase [Nocardia sp. NPDC024068]|uniref:protein kinase domain-containing protein n=1 Tax=Nocardia sp. NPDC024068 TaxID=3157197 RepID=UPI0033D20559